jgi:hypothetical protein
MTETVRPSLHPGQCRSFSPSSSRSYRLWGQIDVLYVTLLRGTSFLIGFLVNHNTPPCFF